MKTEPLNLVFMGSDPIALPLLNWIADGGRDQVALRTIYTQPDRPVGRGQKITANAIKTWSIERGIPVRQPDKLTRSVREELAAESPDVVMVMAYGHILGEAFINTPRLGTLNLHTSILPAYRGASPIQSAICAGDSETGVTLMRIVRELDAGPVADVERCEIGPADTGLTVEEKLSRACVSLICRNLPALVEETLTFREQDHGSATFCRKLAKADGVIDFRAPARVLAARVNGLHPWPGVRIKHGGDVLRLGGAVVSSNQPAAQVPPGTVLVGEGSTLRVATEDGVLELTRLQRPGGKMLPASEFLRGYPIAGGTLLPSEPMPQLVTSRPH